MQTHLKPNHWFIYIEIKQIESFFSPKIKRTCVYDVRCALQHVLRFYLSASAKSNLHWNEEDDSIEKSERFIVSL